MYNLVEEIQTFQKRQAIKKEMEHKKPVMIRCRKCYEQIYFADLNGFAPIRGERFTRRPGCESWPLPGPHDRGMDLICPHAVDGDLHLFVYVDDAGEADSVMLDDYTIYTLPKNECECGCGDLVRKGKEFAHGLECYNRLRAKKAQERNDV